MYVCSCPFQEHHRCVILKCRILYELVALSVSRSSYQTDFETVAAASSGTVYISGTRQSLNDSMHNYVHVDIGCCFYRTFVALTFAIVTCCVLLSNFADNIVLNKPNVNI